ncbi:MAG: hypothetical protein PHQ43_08560, partial [Dehalococcoidales bacterium]|nr:hypothetical protein [Dehalococcoidales bacterium]
MATPTSIELTPTFENIGVVTKYSGTAPTSASMEWRPAGELSWRPGPRIRYPDGTIRNLVLLDTASLECRTSVIRVQDNTDYDVRMTVDGQVVGGTVRTKNNTPPESTNGILRYLSNDGSDGNQGSESAPWRTFNYALANLPSGGKLYIRGYHNTVATPADGRPPQPPSGTPSSWTHLTVWPGYTATLDFVYADMHNGTATWTRHSTYSRIWQHSGDRAMFHPALGERMLFPYTSLAELNALSAGIANGGYYATEAGMIYIILPNDENPNGKEINVPCFYERTWDWSNVNYLRISGLKFRSSWELVRCYDSNNIWVDHNEFVNMCSPIRAFDACGDWTFEYNYCHNVGADQALWPWDKGLTGEGAAAYFDTVSGRRNVFRHNRINGLWEGFMYTAYSSSANLDNPNYQNDADIYDNDIQNYNDDSMELEGACKNLRVYQNRCNGGLMGIAPSPPRRGPVFFFRNSMAYFTDAAVKGGLSARN